MILENNTLLIFGGGRWARILIQAALQAGKNQWNLIVYSPRNSSGMLDWVTTNSLSDKIKIVADLESITEKIKAGIVVNAVNDHAASIAWAIENNIPVLVEKPITLRSAELEELINNAKQKNILIAPAHIFLFCEYLNSFRDFLMTKGEIQSIEINWIDPKLEVRYGEQKSYDASLFLVADWIPHILSVLSFVIPDSISEIKFNELSLQHGGSDVCLHLIGNGIPIRVNMIRDGKFRSRFLKVFTSSGVHSIDFTKEPGTIVSQGESLETLKYWDERNRPTIQLVEAYLKLIENNLEDPRFNINLALKTCQLLDEIHPIYLEKQAEWLEEKSNAISDVDGHQYGLKERLSVESIGK